MQHERQQKPVNPDELRAAIEKAREVILWVESIVLPKP